MSADFECEHPSCGNYALHGICDSHCELIFDKGTTILQCASCGVLVAVFDKPRHISQKYVHCKECRQCTGNKQTEVDIHPDYPLNPRIIGGETNK